MQELTEALAANPYPGRGLLCGRTLGGNVVGGYFVTGRSDASRQREIRPADTLSLAVVAKGDVGFDPLRHYQAFKVTPGWLVFGNGAQVSTVADRLTGGMPPAVAMDNLEHEPDGPIFTDRITAVFERPAGKLAVMGTARKSKGSRASSNIVTFSLRDLEPGEGVLLTTYCSDGQTIEGGEFTEVSVGAASSEDLLEAMWGALNPAYRVAAVVMPVEAEIAGAFIRNS